VFLRRGGFVKHVGRERLVANANKVVFFKAWESYRTSHLHPSGDDCIVIGFGDEALDACRTTNATLDDACAVLTPSIVGAGRALAACISSGTADELEIEERAIAVLRAAFSDRRASMHAMLGPKNRETVHAIETLLTLDYKSAWSLARLGRRLERSPFHLAHLFRDVTGIPIHRYLVNLRHAEALQRLLDGEKDITSLALELGFSSHAHFTASFKAALGVSPSAVRSASNSA
jgi:AraC-like DNA-binding protein